MAQFCSVCGKSARDTAKFCQGCGTPFVQVLQAGSTLDRGRYQVLKPLKSGGMGAVYLLHDSRLERKCVLKEMVPPSHDPADLKEFRERFRNEALTLSKLSHPNLPPVYDHFEENHQCCLVMALSLPLTGIIGKMCCLPKECEVIRREAEEANACP